MQTLQVTVFAERLQVSEYYYTTTQQQQQKKIVKTFAKKFVEVLKNTGEEFL